MARPQHKEFRKEILQTMQVGGAPTKKLAESQVTIMCKLAGPNIEAGGKSGYNNVQVGWDDEIILRKYHFCPTPIGIYEV
ncbi:hypothetical protein SA950122_02178 [Staphylococcus aureus]|nr:hypothetical protein SA950122_02178 [Staphylococcus aureus]